MKYFYDLHIHTALSPCGDDDMTPNNIVNMAMLKGLNIIAITDHNTVKNAAAVISVAKKLGNLLVIPGMELTTEEEVHLLTLFPSIELAEKFEKYVDFNRVKIKNKTEIFGHQFVMNDQDIVEKDEENLLIIATKISLENARLKTLELGGVAIPAHIDKPSNGIIAILGGISPDMGFHTVEVSPSCSEREIAQYEGRGYNVIRDSDSHFLDTISEENKNFFSLNELNINNVFDALKKQN